jgi:hypothetical protein
MGPSIVGAGIPSRAVRSDAACARPSERVLAALFRVRRHSAKDQRIEGGQPGVSGALLTREQSA